jgi:gliding motility-associated-like protein
MIENVKHACFFLACFLIGMNPVDAQNKQNNQWRFGFGSSIDFNTMPPSFPTGAALPSILPPLITGTQIEGTASIADKNTGALLFYTDGITVWNALNQPMPNGTNLGGSDVLSSYMAAVIVPVPGSCRRYYIFCQDDYEEGSDGITYSVLDMSLNNGLGDIVAGQKSIPLYDNNETELLMAYPKSSGDGYWLITNGPDPGNPTLASFDVSSQGINAAPVFSPILRNGSGKLNYQGTKFVCTGPNDTLTGNFLGFELYDFDAATGQISSPLNIPFIVPFDVLQYFEFTFDGNYLYAAANLSLYRFDLTSGNPTTIAASGTLIPFVNQTGLNAALQLGPDSNLYHVIGSTIYQIQNPADLISGPITSLPSVLMPYYCLPQWIFLLPNIIPQGSITSSGGFCLSASQSFTVSDTSLVDSILWDFDDPNSGANNSSSVISPSHTFTAAGQYNISAVVYYSCGVDTIPFQIQITGLPALTVSAVSGTCGQPNGIATANITGGAGNYSYTWSNGATGSIITGLSSGSYSVVATDQNGCSAQAQVNVAEIPPVNVLVTASDTLIQYGDSVNLSVQNGVDYTWTPETGLSCSNCSTLIAKPLKNTTYFVTGKDTNGCAYSQSVTIVVEIICNELFVPDIFSPNQIGEASNEKLCVYSNCIKEMTFGIYNRWGELIYLTNDVNACWDGTHKGSAAITGTYVYRLYVEQQDGQKVERAGNITLVR